MRTPGTRLSDGTTVLIYIFQRMETPTDDIFEISWCAEQIARTIFLQLFLYISIGFRIARQLPRDMYVLHKKSVWSLSVKKYHRMQIKFKIFLPVFWKYESSTFSPSFVSSSLRSSFKYLEFISFNHQARNFKTFMFEWDDQCIFTSFQIQYWFFSGTISTNDEPSSRSI